MTHDRPGPPMWRRYLRMIRPDAVADFEDELHDHLESTVESLVARGMAPDEARAEAIRRFGDLSRVRTEVHYLDSHHEQRMTLRDAFDTFLFDLRYAARGLRRAPVLTAVATISIALGVAANATVFSVVNAMLLRPIPGADAPRLERVYMNHHSPFEFTELQWFRDHTRSFRFIVGERSGILAFRAVTAGEPERIHVSYISKGFFPALGVRMAVGRSFDVDEADASAEPVVVLTHRFWQRRFAGDSSVIGRRVQIADHAFTVVGIANRDFRTSVVGSMPDAFIPFATAPLISGQRLAEFGGSFYVTAQLAPDVSAEQAEAELRVALRQLALTDSAAYEGRTIRLDHALGVNAELRGGVALGSAFMMAMVAMVLLIACANVANLLLGRAAARRAEMGVRLAIGASRRRLMRQVLTESLLLATLGTVAGFAVAMIATRLLPVALSAALPSALSADAGLDPAYFTPDRRVVLFTGALCLATTILFGGIPAHRSASTDLVGMLKGSSRESRKRRRGWLVAAQSAMCVVLLAAASLFLRGLRGAATVDPGFQAAGVIDANLDLRLLPKEAGREAVFAALVQRVRALPGVESAALTAVVPLTGSNMGTVAVPEGMVIRNRREAPQVYFHVVGPEYFATLRLPLAKGREFTEADRAGAPGVAVISEAAARRFWPNDDALGKRLRWGSADGELLEVVGIARDANYLMPGEAPKTVVYVPHAQNWRDDMVLQVRTRTDLAGTRRAIWQAMHELAPALPPVPVLTMTDDMSITLLPARAGAVLLGIFGGIALILASAGIYGVASYSVASRRREIGIRSALGASRQMLVQLVFVESLRQVVAGAMVGVVATLAIGFGLSKVFYGVHAVDPLIMGSTVLVISAVGLLATLEPARRAATADPALVMRAE